MARLGARLLTIGSVVLVCAGCSRQFPLPLESAGPETVTAVALRESARVEWSEAPAADQYDVYLAASELLTPENYADLPEGRKETTSDTALVVTGLTGGTTYSVLVAAQVGEGSSRPTPSIQVSPLGVGAEGPMPRVEASFVLSSGLAGSSFGETISAGGDVNGDGVVDLIVGASTANSPANSGRALVYLGASPAPDVVENAMITAGTTGATSGRGAALVGDLDGDGFDDAVVGSPGVVTAAGRLELFRGSAAGVARGTSDYSDDGTGVDRLGRAVAGVGDIDGDTHPDVLTGLPGFANGQAGEGAIRVYFGGDASTGVDGGRTPLEFESDSAGANLGRAVSAAGDVDGNGRVDLLGGAPSFNNGENNEGAVLLLLNEDGQGAVTPLVFEGGSVGASLGTSLTGGHDFDGDTRADFAAGAPAFDAGSSDEGRVIVVYGKASPVATADLNLDGGATNRAFGTSVAAGDVNSDGFDDLVVGAPGINGAAPAVELFLGSDSGLQPAVAWTTDGGQPAGSDFGAAVEVADLNADGIADVLVGAPGYSGTVADEGGVLAFAGPPTEGPTVDVGLRLTTVSGDILALSGATFADPAAGPWECRVEWGDGTAADVVSDCTPADLADVLHAYANPGRYDVRLQVSNAYGLSGESATVAEVAPAP